MRGAERGMNGKARIEEGRCPGDDELAAFKPKARSTVRRALVFEHVRECFECMILLDAILAKTALPDALWGDRLQSGIAPAVVSLAPGDRIDRYEIRRILGQGGMGIVYEAYDPDLDRSLALKVLKTGLFRSPDQAELTARLLREARAMAKLTHPQVVTVYDVGTFDGEPFLAMELVRGGTLRTWASSSPRGRQEILDAYLKAGAGLAAAHDAGLVHRDFKPDNVLVGEDGRVLVTDFGLARIARPNGVGLAPPPVSRSEAHVAVSSREPLTHTGMVLGTPAYAAPEQLGREGDARADIFAFSVSLYEALYGERPFAGATFGELRANMLLGRVADAPAGSGVPAHVRHALLSGMQAQPEARPPSMRLLLEALDPRARK